MIDQQAAMPHLLLACPSFEEMWQAHLDENGSELLYEAAGAFAHHLLGLHVAGNLDCFPSVGSAIERLHLEGSPWVKEFATVGVLEGIQNIWANNHADPEAFVSFLGSESRRRWDGLNNFWGKAQSHGSEG